MSVSSIIGGHEERASQSTNKVTNDKEMFLKLLVAQLSHQDPLNPQEDKEFIAQLAQFTSLEELQNINGNLETMLVDTQKGKLVEATKLVGFTVIAEGSSISKYLWKEEDNITEIYYTPEVDLASAQIIIRNPNTNEIVYAADLGSRQATTHKFAEWDGKNINGKDVPYGTYDVYITGTDYNGKQVQITTEVNGIISNVYSVEGEVYVGLFDNRVVKYDDISMVGVPAESSGDGDGGDTEGETTPTPEEPGEGEEP